MKLLLAAIALLSWASASNAQTPAASTITYSSAQISVQYAVQEIAKQAGLEYNWQKSHDQTDPECRRWIRDLRLNGVTFEAAMHKVLDPVHLKYDIVDGAVVAVARTCRLPFLIAFPW
jgi:hypothetical protein